MAHWFAATSYISSDVACREVCRGNFIFGLKLPGSAFLAVFDTSYHVMCHHTAQVM